MSKRVVMLTVCQAVCLFPVFAIADTDFLSLEWFLLITALVLYGVLNYKEGQSE